MVDITLDDRHYRLFLKNENNNKYPAAYDTDAGIALCEESISRSVMRKFLSAAGKTDEQLENDIKGTTHGLVKYVHDEVASGRIASIQHSPRSYFVVMQSRKNNKYKNEKEAGVIESPLVGKDSRPDPSWKRICDVKPGDIVFSMSDRKIKSINIATSKGQEDATHRFAHVTYHELENPFDLAPDEVCAELVRICNYKNAPYNKNGEGNQGYLYKASEELKNYLLSNIKRLNPDMDFDFLDEVIEEKNPNKDYNDEVIDMSEIKLSLNMILYGPPGTGKTYNTKCYAVAACDGVAAVNGKTYADISKRFQELVDDGRIVFTTFHQSYSYEDFIEGIKPVSDDKGVVSYPVKNGKFVDFCENARNKEGNCVFIIDEINRGNISKIFGELITLIEDSKREGKDEAVSVKLPYSNKDFIVPNNVYILGTMNTADRSIAIMDTALRRRFSYIEMMPSEKALTDAGVSTISDPNTGEALDVIKMFNTMNKRIERLLDREHTLGHAFFIKLVGANATLDNLKDVFKDKIIPLLQEYFYDDYSKIALVLGDNSKSSDDYKFIRKNEEPISSIFKSGSVDLSELANECYYINYSALDNIESYIEIYQ